MSKLQVPSSTNFVTLKRAVAKSKNCGKKTKSNSNGTEENSRLSSRKTRTSSNAPQRGSRKTTSVPNEYGTRSLSFVKDQTLTRSSNGGPPIIEPLKQMRVRTPSSINSQSGFFNTLLPVEDTTQKSATKSARKRTSDSFEHVGGKKTRVQYQPEFEPSPQQPVGMEFQVNTDLMEKLENIEREKCLLTQLLEDQNNRSTAEIAYLKEEINNSRAVLNTKNVLLSTRQLIEERLTLDNSKLLKMLSSKDSEINKAAQINAELINNLATAKNTKNQLKQLNQNQREEIRKLEEKIEMQSTRNYLQEQGAQAQNSFLLEEVSRLEEITKVQNLALNQKIPKSKRKDQAILIKELQTYFESTKSTLRISLEQDDSFCTNLMGQVSFDSLDTGEITSIINFILGKIT